MIRKLAESFQGVGNTLQLRRAALVFCALVLAWAICPSLAHAAAWVKSVEYVEITLGSGVTSSSTNLTKGQNPANCVPFASETVAGTDGQAERLFTDVFFQTGPARVTAQRDEGVGTVIVGVFVVEFDPANVRVQQGVFAIASATTSSTSAISAVTLTKAALVFYHRHSTWLFYSDLPVAGWFSATNQLSWQRDSGNGTVNGHYYVFESLNSEFSVQSVSFSIADASSSGSATIAAVDPTKSFVIASHRTQAGNDDNDDSQIGVWLSSATTLTARRQWQSAPPPPDNTIDDIRAFVVSVNDGVTVQRGTLSYTSADLQKTAAIAAVNPSASMVWNGSEMGPGTIESQAETSTAIDTAFQKLKLASATSVQGDRGESCASACAGVGYFEVVDWSAAVGGGVTISSASNQSFNVGGPSTPMATIDLLDGVGAITASNDIRIRIPFAYPMRWDPTATTATLGGPAATKVLSQVKALEDSGRTVVLDVNPDFTPGDQLTVSGLRFFSFTAPEAATNLELETENDGIATAFDDKTIQIFPASSPTLSSDDDQAFVTGEPPVLMVPFTVSEGMTASITDLKDIRVRIPSSFNMTWDQSVNSAWILGPAASKVSSTVSFENSDKTLVINVLMPFVTGDFITVSGLFFKPLLALSPSSNLELEVDAAGSVIDLDDKTIRIDLATDVPVFTATTTAASLQVKLEWVYPPGACSFVRIVRDTAGFPGANDPTLVTDEPCGVAGTKGSIPDSPLGNGTTYFYSAYVNHGSGFTAGKFVKARPFDTPVAIHWAYSTGATSMAPPGLRFQLPESFVYAVSNDTILHSMRGGTSGGDWPGPWKPFKLGGPAQARPPVVSFSVGGGNGAAFLGSQDGRVYAVDSVTGALKWDEPIASMVQAAPAGHFKYYNPATFDLILVGTRNGSGANSFDALDVHSGNPVWSFVNSAGQGGDGTSIGIISGGAAVDYPGNRAYFASRTHPTGSADTLWCVSFTGASVSRIGSQPLGNIDGSPILILMNGRVYVGNNAGVVHALNASNCALEWSLPLGNGPIKGFPFPRGTNQLFVSTNTKVWSIIDNITFGSVSPGWPVTTIPSPSIPLYVPGTTQVLVGSGDGKLYQMNVVTPLPVQSVTLGDGSAAVGAPTMDLLHMLIYVGTDAGVVYGVKFPIP